MRMGPRVDTPPESRHTWTRTHRFRIDRTHSFVRATVNLTHLRTNTSASVFLLSRGSMLGIMKAAVIYLGV
jgi:hypothetical protein